MLKEFNCPLCNTLSYSLNELTKHYEECHPGSVVPRIVVLNINGKDCEVLIEPHWTLKRALQFRLGLTGAKHMCDRGVCGSCTVIIDGRPVLSCTTLTVECEGKAITTVEGIAANPKWKPLIDAYCRWDAMQCGYPRICLSAKTLLDKSNPTEDEIKEALSGNICICGTYPRRAGHHGPRKLETEGWRMADLVGVTGNANTLESSANQSPRQSLLCTGNRRGEIRHRLRGAGYAPR